MAHDFLRERLLDQAGVVTTDKSPEQRSLEQLRESEWSAKFESLMRNRLLVGRFRYGRMGDPAKGQFDRLKSIEERLARYRDTGNDELLVDIANLSLVEFVCGRHPKKHFEAVDDGPHVEPLN